MTDRARDALAEAPHLLVALVIFSMLGQTFLARVGHPFDLEWMEGGMLLHAERVQQGLPLYVEPSLEFIPFIYPPLYAWTVGWASMVFELGYPLGRVISMLGTLAAAVALVVAISSEGLSVWLGIGGAALFLTTFDDTGGFFDLVRTDGLLMGLLAWALVCGRLGFTRACGLLLTLSYLTKHNAAAFGVPILLWTWRVHGRAPALRFAAWSVLPALAVTAAVQMSGDGLFLTYLLEVPSSHGFNMKRLYPGSEREMWMMMQWTNGFIVLATVIWLARRFIPRLPRPAPLGPGGVYWLANGALTLALCIMMRGHVGGYYNVLIPGGWILALWGGLTLGRTRLDLGRDKRWVLLLTSIFLAFQIWVERWDVERYTPTPRSVEAGEQLMETLSAMEGPVMMPESPWYLRRTGHAPGFHLIALWDIDHDGALSEHVDTLRAALAAQRWSSVILTKKSLCVGCKDSYGLKSSYVVRRQLMGMRPLRPVTGWPVVPRYVFEPMTSASDEGTR
ncbi:MAG: hypothetical protein AAFV53_09910 [Myxococcota bacterium]